MYLLIPFIMLQYVSVNEINRYILYHYKWYQQIHIVPLYMVSGIKRYILYHYQWYQHIHIVPFWMVSTYTYCTIINGWYHLLWNNMHLLITFIMVQYVSVDTIYNVTICTVSTDTYCTIINGINRYIVYHNK
jgi:hypothetical protein